MDGCYAVEKEVDRVLNKFGSYSENSSKIIEDIINELAKFQKEIEEADESMDIDETFVEKTNALLQTIKQRSAKLSSDHKDLHSTVSKVGKAVDKNFTSDFSCISNENFISGTKKDCVNKIVCQHFYREGLIEAAETFSKEGDFKEKNDSSAQFFHINSVLAALKEHNLQPALEWVKQNKEKLNSQKSSLEFKLHRLAYLNMMQKQPVSVTAAVQYAKDHLTQFVQQHEKAVQALFGCLLYTSTGLKNSPYNYLLEEEHWIEISECFMKDACALHGLSVESPLAVCITAGCTALPILLNIKQVMQQQKVNNIWDSKEELPVEIDLGQDMRFHSIFACPILRQQGTLSNPPMRLICGHVISRDAVTKLTHSNKLKCPYCPVEQNVDDTTFIYF